MRSKNISFPVWCLVMKQKRKYCLEPHHTGLNGTLNEVTASPSDSHLSPMVLDYKCQKCCYSCTHMEGSWKIKLHLMAVLHFGWLLKLTGQICSLETAAGIDINLFTMMKVPDCKQHLNEAGEVNPVWPGTGTGWVSSLLMWRLSWLIWKFHVSGVFYVLVWSGFFLLLYHGGCINVNKEFLGILVYPEKLPKLKLTPHDAANRLWATTNAYNSYVDFT